MKSAIVNKNTKRSLHKKPKKQNSKKASRSKEVWNNMIKDKNHNKLIQNSWKISDPDEKIRIKEKFVSAALKKF